MRSLTYFNQEYLKLSWYFGGNHNLKVLKTILEMMLKNDIFSLFCQYLLNQNEILNCNFFYWKFDIQGFNMDTKFA